MAYTKTTWVDGDNRYDIKTQASAVISADVKLIYVGTAAGTAISQTVMNNIEDGIYNAHVTLETASNVGTATATAEVISLASSTLTAPFSKLELGARTVANILGTIGDCTTTASFTVTSGTITANSSVTVFTSDSLKITVTSATATVSTIGILDRLKTASAYYLAGGYINISSATTATLKFDSDDEDISATTVTATGTWQRAGLVFSSSNFSSATTAVISWIVNGTATTTAYIDGMMLNEITSTEYALGATALLSKYPYHNDIKGSNKMRVLSCGKNLFDKNAHGVVRGKYLNWTTGEEGVLSIAGYTDYIPVESSIAYVKNQVQTALFYDANKTWIGGSNATSFTTPTGCRYVRVNFDIIGIDNFQVERGSVATSYESFKSTSAIVEAVGNSVGDVADKVDCLTGRKEQNVSALTPIATTTYDSLDKATYTNVDVVKTTAFSDMIAQTTSADGTTVVYNSSNKTLTEVAQANIDLVSSIGKYYTHTDETIWFIITPDTYADIAAARTGLGTSQTVYQLAEPITTNYYPNVLESYPSGTVMVLPQVEDKGIYGTNLAITDTDYPISSLVEVWKVNTDDTTTPIAISDCTISAGLTFTISGATAGEYYKYIYNYVGLSSTPSLTYDTADSTKAVENNLCAAVASLDEKIEDVETAIDADIAGIRTKLERYGASSGGNDTYAVTNTYPTKALYAGMMQTFKADVSNTGASTLNVDGLGAKNLKTMLSGGKTATATGDIIANGFYTCIYDGTDFILVNPNALLQSIVTAQGDMLYASAANTITRLAKETNDGAVMIQASSIPSWLARGSAYQTLTMNSGGTAPVWTNPVRIASSSYSGDNTSNRDIALGFAPSFIMVTSDVGTTYYRWIAIQDATSSLKIDILGGTTEDSNLKINGTNIRCNVTGGSNVTGGTYRYVAIG